MKILVVLPRFPFPLEKGDKLRAYHQIRTLAADNEVYLFAATHTAVSDADIEQMRRYCKAIKVVRLSRLYGLLRVVRNFFGSRSLQIGYWDARKAKQALRQFERQVCPDVVYSQMVRTMKYVSASPYPKVMDFQDALSMNLERRMMNRRGLAYFALHYEFKMLRSAEYNAFGIFDALTIISEPDSEAIPQRKDSVIHIIPNGVDFDYFKPIDTPKKYDVVFCGNMQYKPNINAARFLVLDIMPLVWQRYPEARVLIAGATPTAAVRQLAGARVDVSGSVDDIRPCYASSRLFVAPMRIGSGLQNKLLEAMAMGIPCITTPIANASLAATPGTHLLQGQDAPQLAQAIITLLGDQALCQRLAASATAFVHERFSWESAGRQLQQVLQQAIETHAHNERIELEDE